MKEDIRINVWIKEDFKFLTFGLERHIQKKNRKQYKYIQFHHCRRVSESFGKNETKQIYILDI